MSLNLPKGEDVYIDSSIFIRHHSTNLPLKAECTFFLQAVESCKYNVFISSLVTDEVSYILLKQKAYELLDKEKYHGILD